MRQLERSASETWPVPDLFWIGNQGLEYTTMGRVWRILLFAGLLFWLVLLGRALWPALSKPSKSRGLIAMLF